MTDRQGNALHGLLQVVPVSVVLASLLCSLLRLQQNVVLKMAKRIRHQELGSYG